MKTEIVVYMSGGGEWVEVIRMKLKDHEKATKEDVQYTIDQLHNLFYKGERVELTSAEAHSIVFRGIGETFSAFKIVAE